MPKQDAAILFATHHSLLAAHLARRETPVKIVDLSRELYHRTPSYPGHPPIMHGIWKTH